MAPEIIQGHSYNYEVDVWSMGVMLHYLVSGIMPFEGYSEEDLNKHIVY
jgi:calcium-dependent protein kinase